MSIHPPGYWVDGKWILEGSAEDVFPKFMGNRTADLSPEPEDWDEVAGGCSFLELIKALTALRRITKVHTILIERAYDEAEDASNWFIKVPHQKSLRSQIIDELYGEKPKGLPDEDIP